MSKKLDYDYVKESFEKEGYALLSDGYVNSKTKLEYLCDNGHRHSICFTNWKNGYRCPYCSNNKRDMEDIKKSFSSECYTLITEIYKNNRQLLHYICSKGHTHKISWNSWSSGHRCPYCVGVALLNIDFVRKEFEKENYTLFTKKYTNSVSRIECKCIVGHKYATNWSKWQQGYRCPFCAGNVKIDYNVVKSVFKKEGYMLLSFEYINSNSKLYYICPNKHRHHITWASWRRGGRCNLCRYDKALGIGNPNWKGGISCEPYCVDWTKEHKEFIKERDSYKCLNPCCNSKNSNNLSVHHIDYNKKNCGPNNLITLCRSCNAIANYDRKWHTAWYQAILNKRYNYKY